MCIKILDMQFKLQPAHPIPSYIFCEVRPSKNENIKQVLKWGLFTCYNNLKNKINGETETPDQYNWNGYFN